MRLPRFLWHWMELMPRAAYALGLGPLLGRNILLLTTIGRRTGRRRTVPLTYEESGGAVTIASARGASADWFRNLEAHPEADVRIGSRRFAASADVVTDPARIADYLQRLMARNPALFGRILLMEGLPPNPGRADLEALAQRRPMAVLSPRK